MCVCASVCVVCVRVHLGVCVVGFRLFWGVGVGLCVCGWLVGFRFLGEWVVLYPAMGSYE